MRLLIVAACLSLVHSISLEECSPNYGEELKYFCQLKGVNVTFTRQVNDYVNIECMGANFTCADLPVTNFANNLRLPRLEVERCSPSVLQCMKSSIKASSIRKIIFKHDRPFLQADDFKGLEDIEALVIDDGPENYVPVQAIKNLKNLKEFRIRGNYLTLKSNAFVEAPPLTYLEFSMAEIPAIPGHAFNGLSSLITLNMFKNDFRSFPVDAFRGLDSLELLSLSSNQLVDLTPGSLSHVPRLKEIILSWNSLKLLPAGFMYNLTNLEVINIQYNGDALTLEPQALSNLPSLKNLVLEYSSVQNLPNDLLWGNKQLSSISLCSNDITTVPPDFFKDLINLVELDLSDNKIKSLSSVTFAQLKNVKNINLNENSLENLPENLFAGLKNLKKISIDHNNLRTISLNTFKGAEELEYLSLNDNNLTLTSDGYENKQHFTPFDHLTKLKELYVSRNKIENIVSSNWTTGLLNLKTLDLSWNKFTIISWYELKFLNDELTINLEHNNISKFDLDDPDKSLIVKKVYNSKVLLEDNPISCDCSLYNLALRLRGARSLSVEPEFVLGNAKCASPPKLEGRLVKNVSLNELTCEKPGICFTSCSTCQVRPDFNDLYYDCDDVPPNFANLNDFGVNSYVLKLKTVPKSIEKLYKIKMLNVSGIGLRDIPFLPSNSVEIIDFSNNSLTKIPVAFLKHNTTLYLGNNSFECHCFNADDIQYLLEKKDFVKDLTKVTCSIGSMDVKIAQVDVTALCSTLHAAGVASAIFLILVIIVTIIAVAIYKNSRKILIYISTRGYCSCFFIDNPDDIDKIYDVFLTYAHNDETFANQLLDIIENDFGLKACIHYRDWVIGDFIPDQIQRSCETSRKTIILLSVSYLESNFANMEFRSAYNLALKDGKNRVIIILLEDADTLVNHDKMSDDLEAYMQTNTYLVYSDSRFVERLKKAVPLRNNQKFVWPTLFKRATHVEASPVKTVESYLDLQLENMAVEEIIVINDKILT